MSAPRNSRPEHHHSLEDDKDPGTPESVVDVTEIALDQVRMVNRVPHFGQYHEPCSASVPHAGQEVKVPVCTFLSCSAFSDLANLGAADLLLFLLQRIISAITAVGKLKKNTKPNTYTKNQPIGGTFPVRPPITPNTTLNAIQPTIPMKNQITPQ